MEIMYVIAICAVFVLCLALLSTARRILRSSPLASGSLTLSRPFDEDRIEEEETRESLHEDEMEMLDIKARNAESYATVSETVSVEADVVAPVAAAMASEETIASESVPDSSARTALEPPMDCDDIAPEIDNAVRVRKSSRRTYNYALECLLLGVSTWVLIKTQQSNLRYRLPRPSHDRVA